MATGLASILGASWLSGALGLLLAELEFSGLRKQAAAQGRGVAVS